jgi:hypothetical protein
VIGRGKDHQRPIEVKIFGRKRGHGGIRAVLFHLSILAHWILAGLPPRFGR